jgi:pimeloyl-ACP methyl ester carboxylesterase
MDFILIPGLWLDGASWSEVVTALERAGHRAVPVTLPGMDSRATDRTQIGVDAHVAAVVARIDAANGPVVLVGHSLGCGLAWAAVDARVDRVARAILIGGFPAADGEPLGNGFTAKNGELPFPDWSDFDDADLLDLDDARRAAFRARALPSPERVASDIVHLSDDRRFDVPVTAVATEYRVDQLHRWIDSGEPAVQEFTRLRNVTYVDLPTGHWPQFTKPAELAELILAQPMHAAT